MQIFINELSLHEQYYSETDFTAAIIEFMKIFSQFQQHKITSYKDGQVFITRNAIKDQVFQASLEKIKNKALKDAFRSVIFEKQNPKDWRKEQQHNSNDDLFYCIILQDIVTDTTLAEVAERNLKAEKENIIVNFANSVYKNCKEIDIFKNDEKYENPIKISCIEQAKDFEIKLANQIIDYEAFIKNTLLFKKLSFQVQGKSIYQHLENEQYWYLDNFHKTSRHFEVFNKLKQHLGEADLEGNIDYSKADSAKNGKLPF